MSSFSFIIILKFIVSQNAYIYIYTHKFSGISPFLCYGFHPSTVPLGLWLQCKGWLRGRRLVAFSWEEYDTDINSFSTFLGLTGAIFMCLLTYGVTCSFFIGSQFHATSEFYVYDAFQMCQILFFFFFFSPKASKTGFIQLQKQPFFEGDN